MIDVVLFVTEAARPATLLKNRLRHRCFPVNFEKFLRTPFFIEHLWVIAFDCDNFLSYETLKTKKFGSLCRSVKIHKFLGGRGSFSNREFWFLEPLTLLKKERKNREI